MSIGNLKDSGNQGNNFPWQLKMLLGQQCACDELQAINANTDQIEAILNLIQQNTADIDLNTDQVEYLLTAILTALQDSTDYEAKFVVDTCDSDKVYLEVRIWDPTPAPGSWGPITYYLPGSSTPVIPVGAGTPGCLKYTDPTGILGMIYNFLQTNFDVKLSTRASEATLAALNAKLVNGNDIGDVTVNNAAGAAAVNIQDGGNSITVDDGGSSITVDGTVNIGTMPEVEIKNDSGNPIPVTGTVTITDGSGPITVDGTVTSNQGTSPWVVSGSVNIGTMPEVEIKNDSGNPIPVSGTVTITDGAGPITVDATDLDIRNLTFASDKVDVSGSSITATVTATALDIRALDCGTDSVSICDGTNNLAIDTNGSISSNLYANDLVSGSAELVTTTGGIGYQALDVNVVAPINTITPNILSTISSGSIAASVYSITFFNAGNDTELISFDSGVNWVNILPGVTVSMDAGGIANKYPAGVFHYDVIASGPIIITYNS